MGMISSDSLGPTINFGEILVEIMATSTGNGFLEALELVGPFPSGAPAIFIDQCARMGGQAGMIGCVGDDDFGQLNVNRLMADGVITSGIRIDKEFPTGTAFVRYRPDGSRDFVFNIDKSAASRIEWTTEVAELVQRSGHLHVMGTALLSDTTGELILKAAQIVKSRGGSISLDPNLRKELAVSETSHARFLRLMSICDVLLPSGDELLYAGDATSEDQALSNLFDLGIGEVVLKKGAEGAVVFTSSGEKHKMAAFKVTELDPTGAGDCFGGAYIACRRLGMTYETALRYANAAGARNVTVRGPMEGAGTREELDQFIEQNLGGKS